MMSANHLQVRAEQYGQVCVLAVVGDLDSAACEQFTQLVGGAMTMARPRPKRAVLDLSGLRFIDCAGSRALAEAVRSQPGGCAVVVRSIRPGVRRVLDLMCLDLELLGPNLDLMGMDVEHVRGSAVAVAQSPTGRLVRQSQLARSLSEQTMAESRHAAQVIAATEERMAASLIRLAGRRPMAAGRLTALSEAAQLHALQLRAQARRSLTA
jgi:anti-anti-sigma factor